MKLLIIGCGSIGRRHARNARALGAQIALCDFQPSSLRNLCGEIGEVPCYTSYRDAVDQAGADAAVVATPSSLHLEMATGLARRGIPFLVEKPLSDSLEGVDALMDIVKQNHVTAMMAQSFRFHEGYLKLRQLLQEGAVGRLYQVCSDSGWYLPDWHIREDYRREYSGRRELGGGVVLTSFSHSFDTLSWLFGEIDRIVGWKARLSPLSIDVEDSAFCLMHTRQGVVITCSANFLNRLPRNRMVITGSDGHLEADFSSQVIKLWRVKDKRFTPDDPDYARPGSGIKVVEDGVRYDYEADIIRYDFDTNRRYLDEMEYFLARVRNHDVAFDLDLRAGVRVLELINEARFPDITAGSGAAA